MAGSMWWDRCSPNGLQEVRGAGGRAIEKARKRESINKVRSSTMIVIPQPLNTAALETKVPTHTLWETAD